MHKGTRLVLSLVTAGCVVGCASPPGTENPSAARRNLLLQLQSIRIPAIDADRVSLGRISDRLVEQSALLDPGGRGIALAFPYVEERDIPVTLHLRDVTLADAIRALCREACISFRIDDEFIILSGCHIAPGPLIVRCYRLPRSVLPSDSDCGKTPGTCPEVLKQMLERLGVPFPSIPGSAVSYDARHELLTLSAAPETHDVVKPLIEALRVGTHDKRK